MKNSKTLILCDFDGTASPNDVGHQVLKHFSREKWSEIDQAYATGQIGSLEAYNMIASVVRATKEEVDEFIDSIAVLDPHFAEFCRFSRQKGFTVKIVSDGLDYYIRSTLNRFGLFEIESFSNSLSFKQEGKISIEFPDENEECGKCGTCKTRILERHRPEFGRIIYVGDGYSDVCPAKAADMVFAKRLLYAKCVANGTKCIRFQDFGDVIESLGNGLVS